MAYSMDSLSSRGQSEVRDRLKEASDNIRRIGDEFEDVKTNLSDMPGGLDDDLAMMIREAMEQGRQEAMSEIEGVEASQIADAKRTSDAIRSDVTQKMSDNAAASGKLGGIQSKYGRSAIDRASAAIDENSRRGDELMRMLEEAESDADEGIQYVKKRL